MVGERKSENERHMHSKNNPITTRADMNTDNSRNEMVIVIIVQPFYVPSNIKCAWADSRRPAVEVATTKKPKVSLGLASTGL